MNTESFRYKNSIESNNLIIDLDDSSSLDKIAINVIKNDCPDFLLPFKVSNFNNQESLKYELKKATSLEYEEISTTKNECLKLFLNLLTPFVKGEDWFLDYHNICVDPRYVYVDHFENKAYFIYVPVDSFKNEDEEILQFFKNIFNKIDFKDGQDFQIKMFKYFNQNITLSGLYEMIREEMNKDNSASKAGSAQREKVLQQQPVMQPIQQPKVNVQPQEIIEPYKNQKEPAKQKGLGLFTGKPKEENVKVEPAFQGSPVKSKDDDIMGILFGEDNKKTPKEKAPKEKKTSGMGGFSLFGNKKSVTPKSNSVSYPQVETPVQPMVSNQQVANLQQNNISMESDVTEIFEDDSVGGACLDLLESAMPGAISQIDLNFTGDRILIGRSSSDEKRPDVAFPDTFKKMGRRHAIIERRNGKYYLVDLGSANGTLLNAEQLVPNQPYELQEGYIITFVKSAPIKYRVNL